MKIDGSGGMERNLRESQNSVALQCRNVGVGRSHSAISSRNIFTQSTASAIFTIGLKIDESGGMKLNLRESQKPLSCSAGTSSLAGVTARFLPGSYFGNQRHRLSSILDRRFDGSGGM